MDDRRYPGIQPASAFGPASHAPRAERQGPHKSRTGRWLTGSAGQGGAGLAEPSTTSRVLPWSIGERHRSQVTVVWVKGGLRGAG